MVKKMTSLNSGDGVDVEADVETQEVEPHSVPSESGDKVEYWRSKLSQETFPLDEETQVLDDETLLGLYEETQLVEEDEEEMTLFGETQLLEDGGATEGVEVHCDTQILDDHNQMTLETVALENNSEGDSQRTEVLQDGDDDELLDDGTTPNAVEDCSVLPQEPKTASQENADILATQLPVRTCEDILPASSDAHATEEQLPGTVFSEAVLPSSALLSGSGSLRKSFSAVRTTSLRTSGYAITRKLTPKSTEIDVNVSNEKHPSHEKHGNFVGQNKAPRMDRNVATMDAKWASVLDSEARDLSFNDVSDFSDRNKCIRDDEKRQPTGNRTARKLFGDNGNDKEDQSTSVTNSFTQKADPLQLFGTDFQDNVDPGLSYICSQEPGELSQANALDLVDKLVCADEIGLSDIASAGNSVKTILAPTMSVKGAQSLARSADRSPVRKETTFDWIDANEDEGGGEFYIKIKNSILATDKKPRSQPKARRHTTGRNIVEDGKSKSAGSKTIAKAPKSRFSDSRAQADKFSKRGSLLASSNKICNKLFKEKSTTPTIKHRRQNDDSKAFDMDANHTDGIGPDTQAAVEAMEALGSDLCVEKMGGKSVARDAVKKSKRSKQNKMLPNQVSSDICTSGAGNSLRRSKRTKIADDRVNGGSFSSSLNPMKGFNLVENAAVSVVLDKTVAEPLLQKSDARKSYAKKNPTNSSANHRLAETSNAWDCKTRSARKRIQTSESLVSSNQKLSQTNTRSSVAKRARLATEGKDCEEDIRCPSSGTEPKHNEKLDHTVTDDDVYTCDSKYTSPLSKPIDKGSPVCTGLNPRVNQVKTSMMSSVARELIRLQTTELTPPNILQDPRRKRDMSSVCILFSRHLDDDIIKHQKKILYRLGVPIAASICDATHFVADKFVRTRNMLEAMAVGKQVVTPMWLESCGQASCFIDEKNFVLRDSKKEKEIGFSMPASLASACRKPLLQGKRVFITSTVKPDRETVSCLVKAAGGLPMERVARSLLNDATLLDDLLVISCEEDYTACAPLLERGVEVFSSELLLNGIVIQKLEYERHRLFLNHVKRTRSTIWLRSTEGCQFHAVAKRK